MPAFRLFRLTRIGNLRFRIFLYLARSRITPFEKATSSPVMSLPVVLAASLSFLSFAFFVLKAFPAPCRLYAAVRLERHVMKLPSGVLLSST
ncbi:hypothetical protein COLO4_31379 [Corchorus olitorius]|uniref:Uncharacterized protein n=1 Tax=Corchorus olitorius TaxID=93759 RepID=A0A1R3H4H4_9ROSI|nr:hypothetical protein COLO4_31379 [Corchorus olitorius]